MGEEDATRRAGGVSVEGGNGKNERGARCPTQRSCNADVLKRGAPQVHMVNLQKQVRSQYRAAQGTGLTRLAHGAATAGIGMTLAAALSATWPHVLVTMRQTQ